MEIIDIVQSNRIKGLKKIGVSEDDVIKAEELLALIPPLPSQTSSSKQEQLLGYARGRLRRAKALKMLGISEDELEIENAKVLGSLGIAGRRRSVKRKVGNNKQHRSHKSAEIATTKIHLMYGAAGRKRERYGRKKRKNLGNDVDSSPLPISRRTGKKSTMSEKEQCDEMQSLHIQIKRFDLKGPAVQ